MSFLMTKKNDIIQMVIQMAKARNKNNIIYKVDGRTEYLFAQEYIRRNETSLVIPLLMKLLETNYRLQAAFEISYYYFQIDDFKNANIYFQLILEEDTDLNRLKAVKRMQLYLLTHEKKLDRLQEDYIDRQIVAYQQEELISFLKQYRIAQEKKYEEEKFFYFIHPNELIEKVLKYLDQDQANHLPGAMDEYYLTISNVGVINDEIAPLLKVITVYKTSNIIDLKPATLNRRKKIIDCD